MQRQIAQFQSRFIVEKRELLFLHHFVVYLLDISWTRDVIINKGQIFVSNLLCIYYFDRRFRNDWSDNMSKSKNILDRRKKKVSIIFKSVAGIILLLTVFSLIVSIIGYNSFTDALLSQYADGAFRTAETAAMELDTDKMEDYSQSGGITEEYKTVLDSIERLCNSSGATFIYVIRPDLTDYGHITFLFSTINENSDYTRYEFGYVRETTNDEYREKYRMLYEGKSERELVIRDKGYIETDAHITAMMPLKDSSGKTTAILCVQRQMDIMVNVRNSYINKVFFSMIGLVIFVIVGQTIYLHTVFLRPVRKITEESSRFAKENTIPENKLTKIIRNNDEIGILADSIDNMEEKIVKYVSDLTNITAERERINTELSLAARIQASMLPNVFPPFPNRKEFDIYASMTPAKEVGGDFYDFFFTDDDHLCMIIADVSGKGVPAALFMMAAKIIFANYAKMGKSPSEILTAANTAICAHNYEDMFVTVWLGILEISTGKLQAANAGHEYPAIKKAGGNFELFKDKHGFVIGGMDGMKYKQYEIQLDKGDTLFLYTDGVPEATDKDNQLFGTERMLAALNISPDSSPKQILENVRQETDRFADGAQQFDDLTMLCIRLEELS